MVKRIIWQVVLKKAQKFKNWKKKGRKGCGIASPSSVTSQETKQGESPTRKYYDDNKTVQRTGIPFVLLHLNS